MDARALENNYRVKPEELTWKRHSSGLYDVAVVGNYAVYKELEADTYEVVLNNSVCKWRVDLSQFLPKFPTWEDVRERG